MQRYRNRVKGYPVKARSRKEIEDAAFILRREVGFGDILYFPIIPFIESFPGLNFEVYGPDDKNARYPGVTEPQQCSLRLREDIYQKARKGVGWARGIAAHEFGHFFLKHEVVFAKMSIEPKHEKYEDSEWQANVFYSGLLAPTRLIRGLSSQEIAQKCGIAFKAAEYLLWLRRP